MSLDGGGYPTYPMMHVIYLSPHGNNDGQIPVKTLLSRNFSNKVLKILTIRVLEYLDFYSLVRKDKDSLDEQKKLSILSTFSSLANFEWNTRRPKLGLVVLKTN